MVSKRHSAGGRTDTNCHFDLQNWELAPFQTLPQSNQQEARKISTNVSCNLQFLVDDLKAFQLAKVLLIGNPRFIPCL